MITNTFVSFKLILFRDSHIFLIAILFGIVTTINSIVLLQRESERRFRHTVVAALYTVVTAYRSVISQMEFCSQRTVLYNEFAMNCKEMFISYHVIFVHKIA